jgi:hypothetical protein
MTNYRPISHLTKAKAVPLHATEALERERRYSSYSFSTSALNGGEWSVSRPGRALAPGKGPLVQEDGWAPDPVWIQRLEEKSFHLCWGLNLDRPVVQPIANPTIFADDTSVIISTKMFDDFYRISNIVLCQ